ncbi:MAG: hybrid sensor histidine kinase/response regulator [Oxalobacteraceae bacterium]
MSHYPQGDLSQYSMRDLFRMDAKYQTQLLTEGLLAMERNPSDTGAAESIMRATHSIKGAAAIIDLQVVVQLAHVMEGSFLAIQHGKLKLTPERIDVLLSGVDLILQLSYLDDAGTGPWLSIQSAQIEQTLMAISNIADLPEPNLVAELVGTQSAEPLPRFIPAQLEFVPLCTSLSDQPEVCASAPSKSQSQNFDRLLALASESRTNAHLMHPFIQAMQRFKRNQSSLFAMIEQLHEAISHSSNANLKEKSLLALQKTHPLKQFMLEHLAEIESYEQRLLTVSQGMVDEVLALRMRPFRDGIQSFPRMVRDLARSLGKEAQLEIKGDTTLVDRDILTRIESPLNHILRNAIDHGLELPHERTAAGKPALGTIRIDAKHRAGMLNIDITDDGRGVDIEKIRQLVIEREMASPSMAADLTQIELLEFLFLPAFSLKASVNELSGRGVGLDIVYETIRQQNGTVTIESEPGLGFCTSITLPLTQSIVRALVVGIKGEAYAIPIVKVERVLKVPQSAIHTLENKQFFDVNGEHLGLVSAAQVLELGEMEGADIELAVVVIGTGAQRYAMVVDAIRGEQSLTVQAIDPIFGKMRDISAAALLDDGEPVLILDVPDLLLSIDKLLQKGGPLQLSKAGQAERYKMKRVLVVDDSLTVREMERKLLLGRGYEVDISIDGIDGWNAVRSGAYDLVITDVDMPRMDGIELVTLIKNDPHLHKLPIMIVSYKDRPEDRAHGLSAGADYYLTKGSFHDETLLDAVVDLIGDARR